MRWVAPTEKDTANETMEKRLWAAADQFRANSGLKAGQYSSPVLGLIFLLDTIQAAVLLERLKGLQGVIERRRSIAAFYQRELSGCVEVPREAEGARDVYYTFRLLRERFLMPEVFRNDQKILCVDEDWIRRLKDAATASPLRRARLCLHLSHNDPVQEMLIVLRRDVLFLPHRHADKTESFHVIEGEFDVVVFGDEGIPERAICMGPPGGKRVFCYRLSTSAWHAMLPRSDFVVFHEVTTGPFNPAKPAEFAPWAPTEADALRSFLETSLASAPR